MVHRPDEIVGDGDRFTDVFVYGTLLAGECNHGLLAGMEFLGVDVLVGATLYDAGSYPYLLLSGTGAAIGELYCVDGLCLARLDRLEQHPQWYVRRWVQLQSSHWAWVYEGPARVAIELPKIVSGDWRVR